MDCVGYMHFVLFQTVHTRLRHPTGINAATECGDTNVTLASRDSSDQSSKVPFSRSPIAAVLNERKLPSQSLFSGNICSISGYTSELRKLLRRFFFKQTKCTAMTPTTLSLGTVYVTHQVRHCLLHAIFRFSPLSLMYAPVAMVRQYSVGSSPNGPYILSWSLHLHLDTCLPAGRGWGVGQQ